MFVHCFIVHHAPHNKFTSIVLSSFFFSFQSSYPLFFHFARISNQRYSINNLNISDYMKFDIFI
eukprot:UN11134